MPISKEANDAMYEHARNTAARFDGQIIRFASGAAASREEAVVLWERSGGTQTTAMKDPYVVHSITPQGGTFSGGYYETYEEADKDFEQRVKNITAARDDVTEEAEEAAEVAEEAAEAIEENVEEVAETVAEETEEEAEILAEEIAEAVQEVAEVAEEAAEEAEEAEEQNDGITEEDAAEEAILAADVAATVAVETLPPEDVPPKVSHWFYKRFGSKVG